MPPRSHREGRPLLSPALLAFVLMLTVAGSIALTRATGVTPQDAVVASVATPGGAMAFPAPTPASPIIAPVKAAEARRDDVTTATAKAAKPGQAATAAKPLSKPKTVVPARPRIAAAPVKASVDAYRGLGAWVDIYDEPAWANPGAAVRDMYAHGVRTLYLETANSRTAFALKDPDRTAAFLREAHARKMRVVAWYLPDLKSVALDYTRVARAMTFRTKDGHRFDSFALDIESPANRSVAARNKALLELSGYMRRLGGPSYPLGAIIPSPKALANPDSYWHDFPYASVARTYDAFVPMSYYSWHGDGEAAAYADTLANVRVLRSQKGCANVPIHMIGGLVEGSTPAEVRAFVRGNLDTHTIGASLYEWAGTRWVHWKELSAVRP